MKNYLLMGVVCMMPFGVLANGFRLPDQDAAATARGEAFAATADNPSAIYYNPAGITQLEGWHARVGLYAISFTTEFNGTAETDGDWNLSPQLFAVYAPAEKPLAFGLGVYAPYGLKLEWPETTGFRSAALAADLKYVTVNPVVAWRVSDRVSVAAGPTFNFSDLELRQGLSPFAGNDSFTVKGDGEAMGFNLGLRWEITEQFAFGAAYRSKTEVDFSGSSTFSAIVPPTALTVPAKTELVFPQSVVGGLSWRPTPAWNFEVNVDWTDWNQLNTVTIQQAVPVPPLALNWESSLYYEFGVTRSLGEGWRVSAGYILNENSAPDAGFTPLVPDLKRQFVSLGVGCQGARFSFDVAYQYGFAQSRTVTGSPVTVAGESGDGTYDFNNHAVSVSLGWAF